jgi:transposase
MEVVVARCAGLDVHKATVQAHVRTLENGRVRREAFEFGTFTKQILEMRDWLAQRGVTHVAMESTGCYWRPIYNILEGGFEILVCNAQHMKNVPGRKTDVKDAQWIADLLAHGLLRPSFIPHEPQRALRDLCRGRVSLVQERSRIANRINKLLEEANIKLSSVASDVLGVSGRLMLEAISQGEDNPRILAKNAKRKLRKKRPALTEALNGRVQEHQRILLRELLNQVASLDSSISALEKAIEGELQKEANAPFERAVTLIQTVPGVAQVAARAIIGEIGYDMSQFGSANRLCAWAGIAPGNRQSGGKRLSAQRLHGNKSLVTTLVESALVAARLKDTYLCALWGRLSLRRGKKRATVAVAHSILRSIFHMLQRDAPYQDLGSAYFDRIDPQRTLKRLTRRASQLGYALQPLGGLPVGT